MEKLTDLIASSGINSKTAYHGVARGDVKSSRIYGQIYVDPESWAIFVAEHRERVGNRERQHEPTLMSLSEAATVLRCSLADVRSRVETGELTSRFGLPLQAAVDAARGERTSA